MSGAAMYYAQMAAAAAVSGHRYYRMNISVGRTVSYLGIAELQLRIVAGGSQVAVGGTASASAVYGGNTAANAFDGNLSTYWEANSSFPYQLIYDFGAGVSKKIVEYAVAGEGGVEPVAWTLEYSDNATTWTVADTRTGQTSWTAGTYNTYTVANP